MPARLCLLSLSLLLLQPSAIAQTLLEPRIGMEALLSNCVLYDPSCLRAPTPPVQPLNLSEEASPAAVAQEKSAAPEEPETTGSVEPR